MIAALIMGRKGSKGFPDKNLFSVLGHPMAWYPMQVAVNTPEIDRAFLSTDDERLMELAREQGIEVIERPAELCTDGALGEMVYVHAYYEAQKRYPDEKIEQAVLLMCNAATVTAEITSKGISVLRERTDVDSAVSVSRYNMWSPIRARKEDSDGLLKPFVPFEVFGDPATLNCDRDSQGDVWFADMGLSVVRPNCLENIEAGLLPQKWMGQNIYPLKQWGGFDVDYEWQIPMLEYWLKKNGVPGE